MKRIYYATLSVPAFLACLAAIANAQDDPREGARDALRELPTCLTSSASRTRSGCSETEETVLHTELENTTSVTIAAPTSRHCAAEIIFEYEQRNTIARIQGAIENMDCAASHGEYTFTLSTKGDDGELMALEFKEMWQRSNDQKVVLNLEYPIGRNVELLRARASRLRCECDTVPEN